MIAGPCSSRIAFAGILAAAFASPVDTHAESARPRSDIGTRPVSSCEGDFDTAPELMHGQRPVWPASPMNVAWIEDREIRRLPMRWEVIASFRVDTQGRARDVLSTVTDPPSFARHTNAAIKEWRFRPASRDGRPVEARCHFEMVFDLG